MHIAIVEDDPATRAQLAEYIQRYTRQYGTTFQVDTFADGDEIAENYRPVYDILFMDIEMKHLDGMETARRIRQLDGEVLIIFITNTAQYLPSCTRCNPMEASRMRPALPPPMRATSWLRRLISRWTKTAVTALPA